MNTIVKRMVLIVTSILLLSTMMATSVQDSTSSDLINDDLTLDAKVENTPNSYAGLLYRLRTQNFINQTQFIESNNGTAINDIYYKVGIVKTLDPALSDITTEMENYWVSQVLSFQNLDGGFGEWQYDASSISNTFKAISVLSGLNRLGDINITLVKLYLDDQRNSLTNGYNSHRYDPDSDVYSTYLAVQTYDMLGLVPVNSTDVADVFIRSQNDDEVFVPANELGGFGKQSNTYKSLYWDSEATITRSSLVGLAILSDFSSIDTSLAVDFLVALQTSNGGFINNPNTITGTVENIAYTSAALEAIFLLGDTPSDETLVKTYIDNLEQVDGGFLSSSTSSSSSLAATFFAVKALATLGFTPTSITNTVDFALNGRVYTSGYGGTPGSFPSLRETFDAVYAMQLTNSLHTDTTSIIDFVLSYKNVDGGFGLTGSYTESTFRAVSIFDMLGYTYADASTTINFLQGLQQSNGGFSKGSSTTVTYVISTYRAVASLDLLGVVPTDLAAGVSYLQNNQNSDGGFGGYIGDTSDVSSTYRAIRGLNILASSALDESAAITFLKNSQNTNGGFRRSPNLIDSVLPSNVSGAVFTYAAIRALIVLGESPDNTTATYLFIKSIRNKDGGYGPYLHHSSDIATTFTSLWVLRHLHEATAFKMSREGNLNQIRNQYENFTLSITGGISDYTVVLTISNQGYSETPINGSIAFGSTITVDTSHLSDGNYSVYVNIEDFSGANIIKTIDLLIDNANILDDTTSDSFPFDTSTIDTNDLPSDIPTDTEGLNWTISFTLIALLSLVPVIRIARRK